MNVARNLGGSFGISISQTMLANGVQRHQTELVQGLNPLNPNYSDWMAKAGGVFGRMGDGTTTAVLYGQVQRQAAMLSYLDVFRGLMVIVIAVAPVVFFMRQGTPGDKPPAGAH